MKCIRRDRMRRCFIAVLLCAVSLRLSNASRQFSKEEKTNVRILYTYIIRVSDEFSYLSAVRIYSQQQQQQHAAETQKYYNKLYHTGRKNSRLNTKITRDNNDPKRTV